jgi:hypothetical protein
VLPESSESSNLKEENTIIFEKSLNLGHVYLIVSNSNVLRHFKVSNFVKLSYGFSSELSVVLKDQLYLFF